MAGGKVLQYMGAQREANSAEAAAKAQMDEARGARTIMTGEARQREQNVISAANSPEELQTYQKGLEATGRNLAHQQKLMDAIDPALMEASKQVLNLLQGGQSGVGNALGEQRAKQRQDLVNSLKQQLGPGAETSSAGQQALNQFDMQTSQLGAQTRDQSIGNLMGVMGQGNQFNLNDSISQLGNMGQMFGQRANRMSTANAQGGQMFLNALSGSNAPVLQSAGGQFIGGQIMGRNAQQLGKEWSQDSSKFMGMMGSAFGGGSGGPPSQGTPMDAPQRQQAPGDAPQGTSMRNAVPY